MLDCSSQTFKLLNHNCLFPGNFHVSTHSAGVQPDDIDFAHIIHEIRFGAPVDQHHGIKGAFNPMQGLQKVDANGMNSIKL